MGKNPPSQAGKKGVSGNPHATGQLSLPTAIREACPRNREAPQPEQKYKSYNPDTLDVSSSVSDFSL